jgi:D-alanyl-D-alanine carboxypeptidase/D-alanyl-D-alanine-endopeptidase (penicillin-binding protein 4)
LSEAVKVILKVSQNLHAEMLLRVVECTRGVGTERQLLAALQLEPEGVYYGDGSGTYGTFTPRFMCRFLAAADTMPFARAFSEALPVLGNDGTLRGVQKDTRAAAALAVRAKTGTMCYRADRGSYIRNSKSARRLHDDARGRSLAFAVFATNLNATTDEAGEAVGEIAAAAYELL